MNIKYFRHRACNIFAKTYKDLWLQEENVGQEIMIEDLTVNMVCLHKTSVKESNNYFSKRLRIQRKRKKRMKKRKGNQIH